jgi:hypothetical protein
MSKELQFLIYNTPQEDIKVDVLVRDETIWLTQKAMAKLFDVQVPAITKHLKNIFEDGELHEEATISKMEIVQNEGGRDVKRNIELYNLDAIISVGYRVNSAKATQFRIWATKTLKEFIQKGFVLDDERLKQGESIFGKDYFRELLDRVRSIRASERRIWQQITKEFYAMVQNKFHFAITGQTAAEIIYSKADSGKDHMGLTTWKNAPDGRVLKSDITTAKNYLPEKDIKRLERAVVGYFDYIEDLIERETAFTMEEFAESVNAFLSFRKYQILEGKGKMSKQRADAKAEAEYDAFNKTQKIISDFDKTIKALEKKEGKP